MKDSVVFARDWTESGPAPTESHQFGFDFDRFPFAAFAFGFPEITDIGGLQPSLDEGCCRFHEDDCDRPLPMFADDSDDRLLESPLSFFQRLASGRTYRFGMFLPLSIDARLRVSEVFDPPSAPQSEVEVMKSIVDSYLGVGVLSELIRGLPSGFTRTGVNGFDVFGVQGVYGNANLAFAGIVQRNIERAFDATLLVEIGRAGTDNNQS